VSGRERGHVCGEWADVRETETQIETETQSDTERQMFREDREQVVEAEEEK
jgi:hypothetical protein